MILNFSWSGYIVVTLSFLAIYYLVLGIKFYQQELKEIIVTRRSLVTPVGQTAMARKAHNDQIHFGASEQQTFNDETMDDTLLEVENLISKVKEAIEKGSMKKISKKNICALLKSILKEYPEIKDSPLMSAINELITAECAKHGNIILSEEETVMLWDGV